jgi:hypothetical protein
MFWILFAGFIIIALFVTVSIQVLWSIVQRARLIMKAKTAVPPPVYDEALYRTREWKALAYYVIKKAGGRCYICSQKIDTTTGTAHHLTYVHGTICDPKWLLAVCWPCHNKLYDPSRKERRKQMDKQREQIRWN